MALLTFFKSSREEVLKLTIEQVVANAGDGNLRDGSNTSQELREFFRLVPSERLFVYARHCLETPFNKNGFVLQDIVSRPDRKYISSRKKNASV